MSTPFGAAVPAPPSVPLPLRLCPTLLARPTRQMDPRAVPARDSRVGLGWVGCHPHLKPRTRRSGARPPPSASIALLTLSFSSSVSGSWFSCVFSSSLPTAASLHSGYTTLHYKYTQYTQIHNPSLRYVYLCILCILGKYTQYTPSIHSIHSIHKASHKYACSVSRM